MRMIGFWLLVLAGYTSEAQGIDPNLLKIKSTLDQVEEARATATLSLDVDFIFMPEKTARLHYQKGRPIDYEAEHFIMLPKRGLDFSWDDLFATKFFTVDRGVEEMPGKVLKVLHVIPTDSKADFALMTLKLDTVHRQIHFADIVTRNDGAFTMEFEYIDRDIFPVQVVVFFEMERIKLPVQFMGKDVQVDRQALKAPGKKTGKITLALEWDYLR
ncbi:MAG: hypothetical protein AAGA85_23820 [Bacteroidota bacterium]